MQEDRYEHKPTLCGIRGGIKFHEERFDEESGSHMLAYLGKRSRQWMGYFLHTMETYCQACVRRCHEHRLLGDTSPLPFLI